MSLHLQIACDNRSLLSITKALRNIEYFTLPMVKTLAELPFALFAKVAWDEIRTKSVKTDTERGSFLYFLIRDHSNCRDLRSRCVLVPSDEKYICIDNGVIETVEDLIKRQLPKGFVWQD